MAEFNGDTLKPIRYILRSPIKLTQDQNLPIMRPIRITGSSRKKEECKVKQNVFKKTTVGAPQLNVRKALFSSKPLSSPKKKPLKRLSNIKEPKKRLHSGFKAKKLNTNEPEVSKNNLPFQSLKTTIPEIVEPKVSTSSIDEFIFLEKTFGINSELSYKEQLQILLEEDYQALQKYLSDRDARNIRIEKLRQKITSVKKERRTENSLRVLTLRKMNNSPGSVNDKSMLNSINLYNSMRSGILKTPKTSRKDLDSDEANSSGISSISKTIQKQCLLLMDTPARK